MNKIMDNENDFLGSKGRLAKCSGPEVMGL